MNEWFAGDTSKKVRAIKHTQGMADKHTTIHLLYGYKKDPDNPEKWIVDDEAAEVVRRIFRLTINGKGPYEITSMFEVVVAEKPVFKLAPLAYLIKELRQGILLIKPAAEYVLHTGGTAVGDDVVHLPARSVQAGPSGPLLLLVRQFLLPPRQVVDLVHRAPDVQLPAFLLEQRIVQF